MKTWAEELKKLIEKDMIGDDGTINCPCYLFEQIDAFFRKKCDEVLGMPNEYDVQKKIAKKLISNEKVK